MLLMERTGDTTLLLVAPLPNTVLDKACRLLQTQAAGGEGGGIGATGQRPGRRPCSPNIEILNAPSASTGNMITARAEAAVADPAAAKVFLKHNAPSWLPDCAY